MGELVGRLINTYYSEYSGWMYLVNTTEGLVNMRHVNNSWWVDGNGYLYKREDVYSR